MEKEIYYTILYEPKYIDSGVISYKPVKVIKGSYNAVDEVFIEEQTDKMYACANMSIPIFGTKQEHILDALENELEEMGESEEPVYYFAFPILEKKLEEYLADAEVQIDNPLEFYERSARRYFLYSLYDEDVGENLYYIVDKMDFHKLYNVGVSEDLVRAIINAEIAMDDQELLSLFTNGQTNAMDEQIEPQNQQKITPETTMFSEIKFDFDPDELEENIKAEVIAQDHVATALVSMLYKNKKYHNHDGLKSNMLILGPSGCGKTELARAVARHLDIPITVFDASSATASGFVGTSVNQCIKDLIQVCNGDIKKAEHGIIVIDEIDKLAQHSGESINKGDVQNELFKLLEGDEITVAGENFKEQSFRFNPKNITFICIGSAQDLIDQKRKSKAKKSIGFNANHEKEEVEDEEEEIILEPKDLMEFGLKPELLRRLPVIKVVKQLNKKHLVSILTHSKISNLRLYEKAFKEVDNVKLIYNKEVLEKIAEKSTKEKAGASGLKRVVDDMLQTAVRKIRLLNGEAGVLILSKETVDNPNKFELYAYDQQKTLVYPPKKN